MDTERAGCIAIRFEYTDGTVVECIDFDLGGRLESDAALFAHLPHCERLPPKQASG
jgi:hypothetical protein